MKKILLFPILILLAGTMSAQQIYRTAYFMEGSTFRNQMNPAFRSNRGYINLPGISNLTMGLNSSSLSMGSMLYPLPDGRLVSMLDKNVTWDMISSKLQDSNSLDMNVGTNLFGVGVHSGPVFWSFDIGFRTEAGFSLPKDMFEFIKTGTGTYDMSGLSVGAAAYLTASFGYSRKIFENLTLGARINYLGGLARANIHYDKLDLTLNRDVWSVEAVGTLDIAATGLQFADKNDDPGMIDLESAKFDLSNLKGIAGNGFTLDLGAEYVILDRIKVSASILNMGYMKWKRSVATRGVSEANYTFEGFNIDSDNENENELDAESFNDFINFRRETSAGFKSSVYPSVVLGAEYDIFGNDLLGVGVTYMNSKTEFVRKSEVAAALTLRPTKWITASASYVVETYRGYDQNFDTFGLAVNFHPCWINFFVGTDFMFTKIAPQFVPIDQKKMNLYMGLAIPLGKAEPQKMRKLGI